MTQINLFDDAGLFPPCPDILGLRYLPNFVSSADEASLLRKVDELPWSNVLQRRVQHYGYRYDYKARRVTKSMYLGALPDFLQSIAERLFRVGLVPELPDQAIVNEYMPGQGISAHIDCEPCFGEAIVTVSLGSRCEMDFVSLDTAAHESMVLDRCSALILQAESRHRWTHAIKPRLSDRGVPRLRRISLTFRRVIVQQ